MSAVRGRSAQDRTRSRKLVSRGVSAITATQAGSSCSSTRRHRLARMLIVAIGDGHATRLIVERARAANPCGST